MKRWGLHTAVKSPGTVYKPLCADWSGTHGQGYGNRSCLVCGRSVERGLSSVDRVNWKSDDEPVWDPADVLSIACPIQPRRVGMDLQGGLWSDAGIM